VKSDAPVPDFIQALEYASLSKPGVVARLKLRNPDLEKPDKELEKPDKVLLTYWPGNTTVNGKNAIKIWDVPLESIKKPPRPDSCVVMYWNEKPLEPGKSRTVGFTYGLVHLVTGTKDTIGASVSGEFAVDKKITITAYVSQPKEGEQLELKLEKDGKQLELKPEFGLKLVGGSKAKQNLQAPKGALVNNPNPVTWNIMATAPGHYELIIHSNKAREVKVKIPVTTSGIFGGS
jgi:hypothetical protein